jgi:hypothetical protein
VHLFGFIIRIYHDERSSECQVKRYILLTNRPQPQTFWESIRRSAANVWSRPVIILKYANIEFPLAMNSLRKEEERNPETVESWRFILDVLTDDVTAHVAPIVRVFLKESGRKNPGVIWILLSRSLLGETNKTTKSQSDVLTGLWFAMFTRGLSKTRQACYWSFHKYR